MVIVGLVVAGLAVMAIVLSHGGSSADGTSRSIGATPASATKEGTVYFRPVLCLAPPYDPALRTPVLPNPPCSASSSLRAQNLTVEPAHAEEPEAGAPAGFTMNNVLPDSALAGVPATAASAERPSAAILLPPLAKGDRYVLGPAEMSSSSIQSAVVKKTPSGQWVVDYATTRGGRALLDKVTAQNFHQFLALDLNGIVYSAPVIEPTQASFSSFRGHGVVSGDLSKADAEHLANVLNGGK
jgi:hypothetical protein